MAEKVYDVVAITGEYTDRNGETKKRYLNCGAVFKTDKGMSIKLECVPVGDWSGWLSLYEPRQKASSEQAQKPKSNDPFADTAPSGDGFDDIPF